MLTPLLTPSTHTHTLSLSYLDHPSFLIIDTHNSTSSSPPTTLPAASNFQVLLSGQSISLQGVPRAGQSDSGVYEVCVCGARGNTLYLVPAGSNCNQDNGACTP